jgi:hypothetical protein
VRIRREDLLGPVPQPRGHDVDGHLGGERQRRGSVAEGVQAPRGQAGLDAERGEAVAEPLRADRSTELVAEDEIAVLVGVGGEIALEAALEAGRVAVENAARELTDAYAAEDEKLARQRRQQLATAEAKVIDLGHRVGAARQRAERAQQATEAFRREHAKELLAEREPGARELAAKLTASVHETLRLARAYVAERQEQDRAVSALPRATPRLDGPPASHAWERALHDLERMVRETPEVEPPLPRWAGLQHREQQDNVSRFEKLRRRKRRTDDEQAELDRLNQGRVIAPAVAIVNEED